MKMTILFILFSYGCFLIHFKIDDLCELDCRVVCIDRSSASFEDYTFQIESVDEFTYDYVIGEKFRLRETNQILGSSYYNIDDVVSFHLNVVSFQIGNYVIFPFRFFYINEEGMEVLIGMK